MATRDHLLGYPPAAGDFFEEPPFCWPMQYPLGTPRRVMDEDRARLSKRVSPRERLLREPILRINWERSTERDMRGLEAKRQRALDEARPIAALLHLDISHVQKVREHGHELVRDVAFIKPEGGYQFVPPMVQASRMAAEMAAQQAQNVNAVQQYNASMQQQGDHGLISDYHRNHAVRREQERAAHLGRLDAILALDPFKRYGDVRDTYADQQRGG